jgi:hypothetical protein
MIDELRRLERRRGRSGKDSVDHPQYGGSDDLANSVAGAVNLVITKPVMSANSFPVGVGKGIGVELRALGSSTLGKPLPGSTFGEEEPEPKNSIVIGFTFESKSERRLYDLSDYPTD